MRLTQAGCARSGIAQRPAPGCFIRAPGHKVADTEHSKILLLDSPLLQTAPDVMQVFARQRRLCGPSEAPAGAAGQWAVQCASLAAQHLRRAGVCEAVLGML